MNPDTPETAFETTRDTGLVSGRFLSDLLCALERQGIPANELLGDLPISLDERGEIRGIVEWNDFTDFMRRLEHQVGGKAGLETCGELIGQLAPSTARSSVIGFAASPYLLYKAASRWALHRTLPGIEADLTRIDSGHLEISARLAEELRPCPQLFHFAIGGARILPRLIGLSDAVVSASISDHAAHYRIAVPPSRSLLARCKRLFLTIFSAGSIVHYLEAQQLQLHAKNDALQRAHDALARSERRYRAITDTAVDVLCEIDETGRIVYVSAAIEEMIGYSPEQVTSSHFRLWIPRDLHERVAEAFDCLISLPEGRATQELVRFHTEGGGQIPVELTARTYDTHEGARRIVCILRNVSDRPVEPTAPERDRPLASERERLRDLLAHTTAPQHPPHAVERSLRQLLARLDESVDPAGWVSADSVRDASQRMTRIVESAIMREPDASTRFQWIETRKLIRGVLDDFAARKGAEDIELRIDLSNAPPLVWTEHAMLGISFASLVDWAIDVSRPASAGESTRTIHLKVEAAGGDTTANLVVFHIGPEHASGFESTTALLALAIASDAVEVLGGRIVGCSENDRSAQSIEFPQPPTE